MSFDINNLTAEQEDLLAEKLLGRLVKKMRNRDTVIIPGDKKSTNANLRIVDSGMISNETRTALAEAMAATNEATTIAELREAVVDYQAAVNKVLLGG
ncbi:hypothetical protein [Maridesulfovibrio sp.]|uniref:hypothetical protein n=1 Tax=Maridesulfovibrio sp. TaxID=2795000 RepID=UPI002AA8A113|nr:hypothetical protein [Maridesulfovibrio sp.]